MSRLLLVIGGGIAAYKCLDLVRRARERGHDVRCVMTAAAAQFVTPLSVSAISGGRVFQDLFDVSDEHDVGHIRLAREAEAVIVAPATADLMAKMAQGRADDLATAILLATRAPVLIAPAMNPAMWSHPATTRNAAQLKADGVRMIGPNRGEMAESGEAGVGRMAEPVEILDVVEAMLAGTSRGALSGRHVLITAGPTHEPIDPVRYIANRSSGKQGYAIATAAVRAGARVTLISGPTGLPTPAGATRIDVETAAAMLDAVRHALPADIAIMAAAVADWRVADAAGQKMKKGQGGTPQLNLVENPDILRTLSLRSAHRPPLVVGFAAETEHVVEHAKAKRASKGCDWIVANDVSPHTGVMGGDHNVIHLITASGVESWPQMSLTEVATALIARIGRHIESTEVEA